MCPYLKRTGPAALKALATSKSSFAPVAAAAAVATKANVDQGKNDMERIGRGRKNIPLSALQRMAGHCPVMGRAMAARSAKLRAQKNLVFTRALHGGVGGTSSRKLGNAAAGMHTSRPGLARAMNVNVLKSKLENGQYAFLFASTLSLRRIRMI